jgi:beta-alanine--pyruvate transaminase
MDAAKTVIPDLVLWMPFTANRQYKAAPRLLVGQQHATDP